ncbi:patatin-like phospholipase family protein [Enterovibrio norvegicus]|uniref:patatin-like phospholipase family protein n=1 Tax=Enterovibrio norvegicus TaxID=188144 RepID=UPI0024B1AB8E|nr:patatin-like phospholipase family protein [Enterovibrio norvegicus]
MQSHKDGFSLDSLSSDAEQSHFLTPHPTRRKRIALVAQGGGQRGIFTSGVLDSFLDAGFDPFEIFIGTSAGALNLSAFICRQKGFGHQFITEFTTDDRFFNLMKYVRRQQFMDLDWALTLAEPTHPNGLCFETAKQTLKHRSAYACATNSHTLEPEYFHMFQNNWRSVLKATCAIPLLYESTVALNGQHYVDGGVSGAIPAREAFNRGADIIVVIRTEPVTHEEPHTTSPLIENFRNKVEARLPEYAARLNIEHRLEKLSDLHHQVSTRLNELKFRYAEKNHENLWLKLKDIVPERMQRNGERWLFGGDVIYRLHELSGHKINADMLEMLTKHYHTYQDSIDFLANPPMRTELLQIAPKTPLISSALLSKPHQLEHDYQDGVRAGRQFLCKYSDMLKNASTITE